MKGTRASPTDCTKKPNCSTSKNLPRVREEPASTLLPKGRALLPGLRATDAPRQSELAPYPTPTLPHSVLTVPEPTRQASQGRAVRAPSARNAKRGVPLTGQLFERRL